MSITVGPVELILPTGPGSLTLRLSTTLREAIQSGRLPAGTALPPSRVLAAEAGCSRWVVTEAYGQLGAEGYLVATTGSATRVRAAAPGTAPPPSPQPPPQPRPRYDLTPGVPDLAAFPRARWAEAYRQAVLELPTDLLAGRALVATTAARTTLTGFLHRTRQVQEDPTQLSLTTGSAAAIGWLTAVLVRLGHTRVAVEDPSWPGLRAVARRGGLEPVPVRVDAHGLVVEDLHRLRDVRLVLVTPAHQFPAGVALSAGRRLELLEWARSVDGLVIEDDYDADFRYDGRPVASLQGMDPDRVVLLGSLSKALSPAIEMGWLIMPQPLIMDLLGLDLDRIISPSPLTAEALAVMIDRGWYERHLRAQRLRYRRRREHLIAALAEHLPQASVSGLAAGLHLPLRLPDGVDAGAVVRAGARRGLGLVSADRYRMRPAAGPVQTPGPGPGLVLGFGNLRDRRVGEAAERLAHVVSNLIHSNLGD
ncbi:MocR-like pyridoxine biosynthesis transcription factor PdxR [Kineosporia succinea]|uniref:GntR family transcriptional regulator/MocR family aminotransferase n=1 Tax=Kineosporia succinea TaxID=84632 RepID=A0ABT9PDL9_9ACTN|nr:PLP-dependent aminotransferase family protein [Kineosporia succinea]MDP9830489.1 GntR family transcriptional regulator/MocR family aminotransferase [Kineosporia succinea]